MSFQNLKDLDDDLLDDLRNSNDDDSSTSSDSFSSIADLKNSIQSQEEKIFQCEREISTALKQVVCTRMSLKEFRDVLLKLNINETAAARKYFREVEGGAIISYSKLIRALCTFDHSDIIVSPQKTPSKRIESGNTIPTMDDFYKQKKTPVTPSKRFQSTDIFSEEYVRTPIKSTPTKKQTPQKEVDPIPVPQLSPYTPPNLDEGTRAEIYNQLIRSFISLGIDGNEFIRLLQQKAAIVASEKLQKLVHSFEAGNRVAYSEFLKEVALIAESSKQSVQSRPKPSRSAFESSMNIFDPNSAPSESVKAIPHSREQDPTFRPQRNILTWEKVPDETVHIGKKIGPRDNRVSTDLFTWSDHQQPEKQTPNSPSAPRESLFSWSSPDHDPRRGRKAANNNPVFGGSTPWGTTEDVTSGEYNPHSHSVTKKLPRQ